MWLCIGFCATRGRQARQQVQALELSLALGGLQLLPLNQHRASLHQLPKGRLQPTCSPPAASSPRHCGPQVCKRWRALLNSRAAVGALWGELVLDFGHELITSVHTPVAWSNRRPGDEEFRAAFAATRLDAHRMLEFVRERKGAIRKLALMHSEGYWAGERGGLGPCFSEGRRAQHNWAKRVASVWRGGWRGVQYGRS